MTISVVISVKNEVNTIGDILQRAESFADEIIVVDGKSTDGSREIVEKTKHKLLKDTGRGKGEAIQLGLQYSTSDVTVFLDADGSHNPSEIPQLIEPVLQNEAELTIGSRILGGSDELGGSPYDFSRLLGNVMITMFINGKYHTQFSDTQNGFRAIQTDIGRSLHLSEVGHTIELEMILKCLNRGYRIVEVPSHEYRRQFGESTIQNRTIWYHALKCVVNNWK